MRPAGAWRAGRGMGGGYAGGGQPSRKNQLRPLFSPSSPLLRWRGGTERPPPRVDFTTVEECGRRLLHVRHPPDVIFFTLDSVPSRLVSSHHKRKACST